MKYVMTILSAWGLSLGSEVLDILEKNEAFDDQKLAKSFGLYQEESPEGLKYYTSMGYQRLFLNTDNFDLDVDGVYLGFGARYYVKPYVFVDSDLSVSFFSDDSDVSLGSGSSTTGSIESYYDLGVSVGFLDPSVAKTSVSLGLSYLFYAADVGGAHLGGSESQLAVTAKVDFLLTDDWSFKVSYLHALKEAQTARLGLTYSF